MVAEPTRTTAITISTRLRNTYLRALTAAAGWVSNRRRREPAATIAWVSLVVLSSSSASRPDESSMYSYSVGSVGLGVASSIVSS